MHSIKSQTSVATQSKTAICDQIIADLIALRAANPLIHNITNFVVMQQTANALLALGASPVMAHAQEEIHEILQYAKALVLNIGTLDSPWIKSMQYALTVANTRKIPVILDPVGAGATTLRTQTALAFLTQGHIDVVRGNAAEILVLAGEVIQSKGVDSQYHSDEALQAGLLLAKKYQCVVVISGAQDLIISAEKNVAIDNGDILMSKVTGMGCTATALIGAFCAVNNDVFQAAVSAMAVMGISGEIAKENTNGPGSFQQQFLDALYLLQAEDITKRLKLKL